MIELTKIQQETFKYIEMYIQTNDNFPTVESIAQEFEITRNAAYDRIELLHKKGYIERVPDNRNKYRRASCTTYTH